MSILNWAAAAIAGYAIYRITNRASAGRVTSGAADRFGGNFARIRDAGAAAQRDRPAHWDKVDEAMDETFPASDPPATY